MPRTSAIWSPGNLKLSAVAVLAAAALTISCGQKSASGGPSVDEARRIRETALAGEKAYDIMSRIVEVGPRLTGSDGADRAVSRCLEIMKGFGFDEVHAEPVTVNRWAPGISEAWILDEQGRESVPLAITALGGSVATPEEGLTAEVIEARSLEDLAAAGFSASGMIVLLDRPMDRKLTSPGAAYGGAAGQRVEGASIAARAGAAGVLVRSLTFRLDDNPHAGMLRYEAGVPQIPAAAVSTLGADRLSEMFAAGKKVMVRIRLTCRNEGPVESANVVCQLTGTEHPEEVVLVGGHLDSWHLSPGAHDDAAGCAACLEALRVIKDLGLRPKRTIRAVMFMDEEFGGTGGRAYADAPERRGEKHILALESDMGGFLSLGLNVGGADKKKTALIRERLGLFRPLGISYVEGGGGGVDVGPLVARGVPGASVATNTQTYFDLHHSALDTPDRVSPRELELHAAVIATLALTVAEEGWP